MIRLVACIMTVVLPSAGSGCGFLQQNSSSSTAVSLPEKALNSIESTGELQSGGEADPAQMNLNMKKWAWVRTLYNNDTIVVPANPGAFTLTFNSEGKLNATTDCNRMTGSYSVKANHLSFSKLAATRMFCPDSQETEFADMLSQVTSFLFTPRGELVLELKFDSGHILLK